MWPGATQFTRILRRPELLGEHLRRGRERPLRRRVAGEQRDGVLHRQRRDHDDRRTTVLAAAFSRCGTHACVSVSVPNTLTSIGARQRSGSKPSNGSCQSSSVNALFTSTSTRPSSARRGVGETAALLGIGDVGGDAHGPASERLDLRRDRGHRRRRGGPRARRRHPPGPARARWRGPCPVRRPRRPRRGRRAGPVVSIVLLGIGSCLAGPTGTCSTYRPCPATPPRTRHAPSTSPTCSRSSSTPCPTASPWSPATFGCTYARARRAGEPGRPPPRSMPGSAPGDHVAVLAWNRAEWIEAELGIYKARASVINVNYRYVADELRYMLENSDAVALVFERVVRAHGRRGPATGCPKLRHFVVIDDGAATATPSAKAVAELGAIAYEDALAGGVAGTATSAPRSADDLYILYTGGTTGMPKGVLWRRRTSSSRRSAAAASGSRRSATPEELAERVQPDEAVTRRHRERADDARRRAVGELHQLLRRQHRRAELRPPLRRRAGARGSPSAERADVDHGRRRRDGPPARRRARRGRRRPRPVVGGGHRLGRRHPVDGGPRGAPRAAAERDRDRQLRRVGDRPRRHRARPRRAAARGSR